MWDRPDFLRLPHRAGKPRTSGVTHVLDKGAPSVLVDAYLAATSDLVDVVKIGWGIGYLDRSLKQRVASYQGADVLVCLGGTLIEIAVAQGELPALVRWATAEGIDAVEVSNGLGWMPRVGSGPWSPSSPATSPCWPRPGSRTPLCPWPPRSGRTR